MPTTPAIPKSIVDAPEVCILQTEPIHVLFGGFGGTFVATVGAFLTVDFGKPLAVSPGVAETKGNAPDGTLKSLYDGYPEPGGPTGNFGAAMPGEQTVR